MKTWPTLFKKTSTGAIQQWTISVHELSEGVAGIATAYGQMDGAVQVATDNIYEGKNTGKVNETSPYEQALAEAESKWTRQKKKGYVESIEEAQAGAVDKIIEGGVVPMLAHKYRDHAKKIKFPAFAQPKLDGVRCLATIIDGKATLWSRTRKPINSCPHIIAELEDAFFGETITLDGELYAHELRNDFEKIISAVRKDDPSEESKAVEYHMYDIAGEGTFEARTAYLHDWTGGRPNLPLVAVETIVVQDEDGLLDYFGDCLARGYEGAMVRNADSLYENKRSYSLQKVKEMVDDEFLVVGVETGRGKMADCAIFVLETESGQRFKAKMKGELENLKQYVNDPSLAIGRQLTVQYQNLTADNIPRFPVGLRFREEL